MTKNTKAAKLKKTEDDSKRAEDEKKRKWSEVDDAARRQIAHTKQSLSFVLEWSAAGHPSVDVVESLAGVKEYMDKAGNDGPFNKPFLVKNIDIPMEKVAENMVSFKSEATKHCTAENKELTVCTLGATHGVHELKSFFEAILPPSLQVASVLPSTKAILNRVQGFASMENHTSCDWEHGFLGSVRYHYEGHCAYLLFKMADLLVGVQKIKESKEPPKMEGMCTWADDLDKAKLEREELEKLKEAGILSITSRWRPTRRW